MAAREQQAKEFIRNVPTVLKQRLVADAEGQGTNLTEVAVGILARKFRVPFEASGRRSSPSVDGGPILLRMPELLHRQINIEAARHGWSGPREILEVLCAHYGLAYLPPARPPRRRRRGGSPTPA